MQIQRKFKQFHRNITITSKHLWKGFKGIQLGRFCQTRLNKPLIDGLIDLFRETFVNLHCNVSFLFIFARTCLRGDPETNEKRKKMFRKLTYFCPGEYVHVCVFLHLYNDTRSPYTPSFDKKPTNKITGSERDAATCFLDLRNGVWI